MSHLIFAQQQFSLSLARLIIELDNHNFKITMGECWRSDETAQLYEAEGKGISGSLHRLRLAVDLNLFKNGKFLTSPEDYRLAGEMWESLSTSTYVHSWGGRFTRKMPGGEVVPSPDADHFSIQWDGVK